jgi:cell division protein FtsB
LEWTKICQTRWVKARQAKALEAEKKRSVHVRDMIAEQARKITDSYLRKE